VDLLASSLLATRWIERFSLRVIGQADKLNRYSDTPSPDFEAHVVESTSSTLLHRLRQPGQADAWDRFARLYTPMLLAWARLPQFGLQDADAEDLVNDVLADLVRKLPEFTYDPQRKFRAWLRGTLHNKWVDFCRRKGRQPPVGANGLSDIACSPDPDPGDAEEQQRLLRRALELMQVEFAPATWKACWATVAEGRAAADVAAELGITENAVYIARSRVLRRLRKEMAGLID
jgi:RNA polymerase sigma-70 factor (ECF subfamily)